MTRTPEKRAREEGASKRANYVITLANEAMAHLRQKLSRPPVEVPHTEVLIKVGVVAHLAAQALGLADQHRKAIAEAEEANRKRVDTNMRLVATEAQLGVMRRRAESAEAKLRRLEGPGQ